MQNVIDGHIGGLRAAIHMQLVDIRIERNRCSLELNKFELLEDVLADVTGAGATSHALTISKRTAWIVEHMLSNGNGVRWAGSHRFSETRPIGGRSAEGDLRSFQAAGLQAHHRVGADVGQ